MATVRSINPTANLATRTTQPTGNTLLLRNTRPGITNRSLIGARPFRVGDPQGQFSLSGFFSGLQSQQPPATFGTPLSLLPSVPFAQPALEDLITNPAATRPAQERPPAPVQQPVQTNFSLTPQGGSLLTEGVTQNTVDLFLRPDAGIGNNLIGMLLQGLL